MFINFLIEYWYVVVIGVFFLIGFIFDLINVCRKPSEVIDTIKTDILTMLPQLIQIAEAQYSDEPHSGAAKKLFVITAIMDWFKSMGYKYTESYKIFIEESLEKILSTPQKK